MSSPQGHFWVLAKTGRSTDVAPPPSSAMKSKFLNVNNKNFGSQVISIVVAAALVLLIGVWVYAWLFGARRRRQTAPAYYVENFGTQEVDARRGGIKGGKGGGEVSLENHNDAGRVALVLMAGEEAPTFLAHPTPYLKSSEGIIQNLQKQAAVEKDPHPIAAIPTFCIYHVHNLHEEWNVMQEVAHPPDPHAAVRGTKVDTNRRTFSTISNHNLQKE